MSDAPVWLLDVDGVLNASRPGWGGPPRKATAFSEGTSYTLRWAPPLLHRIRELHRAGTVDIRWATTWCTDVPELTRVFGLELEPAFRDRPPSKTWAEIKAEAAVEVLTAGRRLIWTDDAEVPVAPKFYPALADAAADGRALLIAPRPNRGLQPEHLDAIEGFAANLDAAA